MRDITAEYKEKLVGHSFERQAQIGSFAEVLAAVQAVAQPGAEAYGGDAEWWLRHSDMLVTLVPFDGARAIIGRLREVQGDQFLEQFVQDLAAERYVFEQITLLGEGKRK